MSIYDSIFRLLTRSDVSKVEGRIPHEFGQDAVEIPGARSLLDELDRVKAPWTIGKTRSLLAPGAH